MSAFLYHDANLMPLVRYIVPLAKESEQQNIALSEEEMDWQIRSGRPVLYLYARPCVRAGSFPMSVSGFYAAEGKTVRALVRGYECGGSAGGDYAHLWRDKRTGGVRMGTSGLFGGFGGMEEASAVYTYQNGSAGALSSCSRMSQTSINYSQEELTEQTDLFYDENNQSYTADTIQGAEGMTEYTVDGKRTTLEAYEETKARFGAYR